MLTIFFLLDWRFTDDLPEKTQREWEKLHIHSSQPRLNIVFVSVLPRCCWRKMIIIADKAEAGNDDSVTAESFLICRIRLWHAPSQNGDLFICAEERGKGGQLASTIRQANDKHYITMWDSQTNESGSRDVHPGRTEPRSHPAALITCIARDIRILYSHALWNVAPHTRRLLLHCVCCHTRPDLPRGTRFHVKRYPAESMLHQMHAVNISLSFTKG